MSAMRIFTLAGLLAGALFGMTLTGPHAAWGQTPPPPTPPQPALAPGGFGPGPGEIPQIWGAGGWEKHIGMFHAQSQAAQLAQQYVKTDKEDEKRDLRKKLTDVLSQQFDTRMQQQKKELEDLEKEIAHLRDVIGKRQASKEKIVERHVEQLLLDAEGLGWSAPSTPRPGMGGGAGLFVRPAAPERAPTAPRP